MIKLNIKGFVEGYQFVIFYETILNYKIYSNLNI